MDEQTSIAELSSRELPLPLDLQVIRGYNSPTAASDVLPSLDTGSLIRVHFFRDETIVTGQSERGDHKLTITLNCEELFELLPSRPELDDVRYETAGHVGAARPRPETVRATQSWQGDNDEIQGNDELENIEAIENDVLGRYLSAIRIVEGRDGISKEHICIPYNTPLTFTTRANPRKRYRLVDLVRRNHSLPQRVRVHSHRVIHTGLPPVPVKAKLLKVATQQVAVCSDLADGRVFILPANLEGVLLRVQRMDSWGDYSPPIRPWMDVSFLPRVGPEPLDDLFGPKSVVASQKTRIRDLHMAVLIPNCPVPTDDQDSTNYKSFTSCENTKTREKGCRRRPVDSVQNDDASPLSKHCTLHAALAALQCLVPRKTTGDEPGTQTGLNEYEGNIYAEVILSQEDYPASDSEQLYVPMYPAGQCPDDVYDYAYSQTENIGPGSRKPASILKPSPESPAFDIKKQPHRTSTELENQIDNLRLENERLCREITRIIDQMTVMQTHVEQVDEKLRITEIDQAVMRRHLESLSSAQIARLLDNVGMGQYKKQFVKVGIQGYKLGDCDVSYLQDIGMPLMHASKLLTILRGRLPPGTQWENLI
ncbi:uncharacterized protein LOC134180853 [Corticium candelabrum]|uniref:uncharacterized protein LOC134180853 n=1 Tax=Corticium candelabrum TaxID=121492 RepID=UPI002E25E9E3|nr:uncharacterized protein LOC134180853 [Corticium candelabrum]